MAADVDGDVDRWRVLRLKHLMKSIRRGYYNYHKAGSDLLDNIQNVTGSPYNDADSLALLASVSNILKGGNGDDKIDGSW